MTIHEAVSLVLQASLIGEQGDTLVLEMGRPVSILELARTLIRLSGKNEKDVPIQFTGVRQGERLSEELFYETEEVCRTPFRNIKKAHSACQDWAKLSSNLEELRDALFSSTPSHILARIKQLVPEYSNPFQSQAFPIEETELRENEEPSLPSRSESARLAPQEGWS
jgi:FlaA1/EpsC-like NDP-sugar epimerase